MDGLHEIGTSGSPTSNRSASNGPSYSAAVSDHFNATPFTDSLPPAASSDGSLAPAHLDSAPAFAPLSNDQISSDLSTTVSSPPSLARDRVTMPIRFGGRPELKMVRVFNSIESCIVKTSCERMINGSESISVKNVQRRLSRSSGGARMLREYSKHQIMNRIKYERRKHKQD